jgi:hypothetical protein
MRVRPIPFRRWLNVAVAIFVVLLLIALILPAVQQAREAARRTQVKNTLHQFGLALDNYHDAHRSFPPGGVTGGDGMPYHGWCLMTGPYMDASPLYSRVNYDVPWDDPENDFLWLTVLPWCVSPQVVELRTREGYGLLHYQANPHLLHRNSSVTVDELTAGAGHTWAIGEAGGEFTPYAYPFNWRPLGTRLNVGTTGFGLPGKTGLHLLFSDGAVRFLSSETSADVLRTMADAPPVPDAAAVAVPPRPAAYRYSGRHETSVALREGEFPALWAHALLDRNEVPLGVSIVGTEKDPEQWPVATIDDLRRTAAAFPAMRRLSRAPEITDEAAVVLSSLVGLESLHAEGARVSDAGLRTLVSLARLQRLSLSAGDDEMVGRLQAALPKCRVEIHEPLDY